MTKDRVPAVFRFCQKVFFWPTIPLERLNLERYKLYFLKQEANYDAGRSILTEKRISFKMGWHLLILDALATFDFKM